MLAFRTELELIADYKPWNSFSNQRRKQQKIGGFFEIVQNRTFYHFAFDGKKLINFSEA
jgi:hypothetical protein